MSESPAQIVARALVEVGQDLPSPLADQLAAVYRRADDPPTIAIAGRVSSGKSTLLNALVGQPVAPTDAGECTQVIARFRYGRSEHIVAHTRDGGTVPIPMDDRRVPATLPLPASTVHHLEVFLPQGSLRDVELVDTPGLSSSSSASAGAEAFLGVDASRHEVAQADGVVYLLTPTGRADEAEDLSVFGTAAGGRADAAIGVLGKADLVADGDPAAIDDLADRLRSQLATCVSTVVPLWTLVAETTSCGRFRNEDARVAAEVAALGEAERAVLTASAGLFATHFSTIDAHARKRLVDLLGFAGVRRAVACAEHGMHGGPAMADHLQSLAGLQTLRQAVDELRSRVHVIRAARMLTDAERIGYGDWETGAPLRDAVDELRARSELHVLEETVVIDDLRSGRVPLPADAVTEAIDILTGNTVADLAGEIDRWREVEALTGEPQAGRAARTIVRTLSIRRRATP